LLLNLSDIAQDESKAASKKLKKIRQKVESLTVDYFRPAPSQRPLAEERKAVLAISNQLSDALHSLHNLNDAKLKALEKASDKFLAFIAHQVKQL